jgi:5,10-methylenetetrahydromethanopterin reductase
MAESARKAGRQAGSLEVVQYTPLSVLPDSARARSVARPFLGSFLSSYSEAFVSQPAVMHAHADSSGLGPAEFEQVLQDLAAGRDAEVAVPDTLLDAFAISGTPDQCAELLGGYRDAGVQEVVALLPPTTDQVSMIRLIGEAVLPAVGAGRPL